MGEIDKEEPLETLLLDALQSIADHSSEFAGAEDAETMVARMTEKAREAIALVEGERRTVIRIDW